MTETERILNGLKDACLTSFFFKDGDFTEIKPEYLLTTLVAKQFAYQDSGLLIRLEEPTCEFATSCVKQINDEYHFSKRHNVSRNGKIDIAIYFSETQVGYLNRKKSNFPIELKGLNTNKCDFLKDIERNLEYFDIEDKVTGSSVLNRTFNASIEEAKKFLYKEEVENFIKAIKMKYENWFKPYSETLKAKNLQLEITVIEIMSELHSKNDTYVLTEGATEWDYLQDWHLYVGVVVEIYRKNEV